LSDIEQEKLHDISKACRALRTSRSSYRYRSIKDDYHWELWLRKLVENHPREGFWKSYYRLRNSGGKVNHKKLHRIYKKMGLPMRRKVKKRLPQRVKESIEIPKEFTHTWSIDFMHDVLENGRKFKSFNVIDDYNREVLHIELDYSIKSSRVLWVLRRLIHKHGKPKRIRMDNGPEFIAKITQEFSEMQEIDFKHIQPGKPTQNALIERFNKTYRDGVLDAHLFTDLNEVREVTDNWVYDYNHHRPHDALAGQSPIMWKCGQQANPKSHSIPDHIPTLKNNDNHKNSIKKFTLDVY
jgi:putative transposase